MSFDLGKYGLAPWDIGGYDLVSNGMLTSAQLSAVSTLLHGDAMATSTLTSTNIEASNTLSFSGVNSD